MTTSGQSLPLLHIKAENNYEVGYQIGFTFKSNIDHYFNTSSVYESFASFYNTEEGRKLYESYLKASKECYPNIVDEIKGMAEGSGQSFEKLFFLSLMSEIELFHNNDKAGDKNENATKGVAGCTDVLVNSNGARIIGHNEDWTDDVDNMVYMVHVTVNRNKTGVQPSLDTIQSRISTRDEQFVSFLMPGILAGVTFSMNKYLIFTCNTLVPSYANAASVPVSILLRALMACKTVDECVVLMENAPVGCAYGININIASTRGVGMWSLELYPYKGETKVDVHEIAHKTNDVQPCHYFHQNHYTHTDAEEIACLKGSRIRERRANELPSPRTIEDVLHILGDTEDPTEQIYRVPGCKFYTRHVKTIATALFDLSAKTLNVYRSNPALAIAPAISIPFLE